MINNIAIHKKVYNNMPVKKKLCARANVIRFTQNAVFCRHSSASMTNNDEAEASIINLAVPI